MRLLMALILLAFPILDVYLLVRVSEWAGIGWPVWVLAAGFGGWFVIRSERRDFRERVLAAVYGGQPLLRTLFESGRRMLAGALLIFPGALTDLVAVTLLMLPARVAPAVTRPPRGPRAGSDVIEGEYERLD